MEKILHDYAINLQGIGFWCLNCNSNKIELSSNMYDIVDLPSNIEPTIEILKSRFFEEDLNLMDKKINYIIKENIEDNINCEIRFFDSENNLKYLDLNFKLIINNEKYIVGNCTDITKYKNEIKNNNKIIKIFDNIPIMIYYKDLNNNIIKCNQTFANFVGLHKQQIEGKNLRDIFDNEENILNYNIINNDSYNKLIFRCNKYIKETEIPNYSINKKLNGIIVLSVDVTEEILLKNKKYEDEEIYKTIIQEINEPIFIVDKDFNIIISNCKAKETFNLNGNKNNILDMLYDENSKNIITLIKDKKFLYVKEEIRIKSYEDNFITYELSYSPIKINEELATGIFILTDITERIEKEKFVKVTNTFLQKKNKELEDFVYIISHDLKVPLRQTKMFLDILEKNNDKEIMKKIKELSVKMQNLIDDLLKLSKAITEHESKDYYKMSTIIDDIKILFDNDIRKYNIKIIIDKDFYLYCDKNKMSQVFTNLISNSIKFRKKDIPSIIRINFDENNFKINISDNGVGFDNKFKEKIFEVFQRLYTEEKYDGTGIGLTICKKIIEDSGLEIEANGKINEGTTFSIIIPKEKEKYVKQI